MQLLDKLLKRLKEQGHRVLIFSQMVRMLDLLSLYCRMRGFQTQRIDGSTDNLRRQQAMDHFNLPGSSDFVFLLSTRAGGLGINLATANTVVIFDSDWNPQNDLQAMSRAHRIGQKDTVNIYRFVTKATVEEDILERAKQKLVLSHLVIQQMDTTGRTVLSSQRQQGGRVFDTKEMQQILRFGASELFGTAGDGGDGGGGATPAVAAGDFERQEDFDFDAILERAENVVDDAGDKGTGTQALLSQFKVTEVAGVAGENGGGDANFWERLIPKEERPEEEAPVNVLVPLPDRAARMKATNYAEGAMANAAMRGGGGESAGPLRGGKPGPPLKHALKRVDFWPAFGGSVGRIDAKKFVGAVKSFGDSRDRLDELIAQAGGICADATPEAVQELISLLLEGCSDVVAMYQPEQPEPAEDGAGRPEGKPDKKEGPILDFFGTVVKAAALLARVDDLAHLQTRVAQHAEPADTFRIPSKALSRAADWSKNVGWTSKDDAMLVLGCNLHGYGNWAAFAADASLGLGGKIDPEGEAPSVKRVSPKQLDMRAKALLRQLKAFDSRAPPPPRAPGRPAARRLTPKQRIIEDLRPITKDVKKLRALNDMTPEERKQRGVPFILEKTKKYLLTIGAFIEELMRDGKVKEGKEQLTAWRVVKEMTKNDKKPEMLMRIYAALQAKQRAAGGGAAPAVPSDAAAASGAKRAAPQGGAAGEGGGRGEPAAKVSRLA